MCLFVTFLLLCLVGNKKMCTFAHGNNSKQAIMGKKKVVALSQSEKIAALEKRIAAKVDPKSKVTNSKGEKVGSVKLRHKQLADGRLSFYLDVYRDGKRVYDFLGIYLDPSDVTSEDNIGTENENAILEAETKRATKVEDMKAGNDLAKKASIRSKMLLKDWMQYYSDKKRKAGQSDANGRNIEKATLHLIAYKGDKVTMGDIDKEFCEGFLQHLAQDTITGKPLAKATQAHYYKLFRMAMGEAVRKRVIAVNPATQVDNDLKPKVGESKREHLDLEEVKALIATPCSSEATKRAYLFSCFCGLRCSDIAALTWGNIVTRNGQKWIEITMRKTQKPLSVPLIDEAQMWMPERGDAKDTDKVFSLPSEVQLNKAIKTWAKQAGIDKHLSFHTARHTFATLALTADVELYTVSKLLGHTNVKTTQIYAKVVDKQKEAGMNKFRGMLNN